MHCSFDPILRISKIFSSSVENIISRMYPDGQIQTINTSKNRTVTGQWKNKTLKLTGKNKKSASEDALNPLLYIA